MNKTSELLKEFEELCKFVRKIYGDDIVCGYCEYDGGTGGEEPMECPGFETDECFKLKEEFKKRYLGENRMKAILVIDMPNELDVNDLLIDYCVHTKGEYKQIRKGGNYSLKPMPEKLPEVYCDSMWWGWNKILDRMIEEQIKLEDFAKGWNACLEELEK